MCLLLCLRVSVLANSCNGAASPTQLLAEQVFGGLLQVPVVFGEHGARLVFIDAHVYKSLHLSVEFGNLGGRCMKK